MPSRTPCAMCGRTIVLTKNSLGPGKSICHPCRRANGLPVRQRKPQLPRNDTCVCCEKPLVSNQKKYCSVLCANKANPSGWKRGWHWSGVPALSSTETPEQRQERFRKYWQKSNQRRSALRPKPSERPCASCGTMFQPKTNHPGIKYCSRTCLQKVANQRARQKIPRLILPARTCTECGKSFVPKQRQQLRCSAACGKRWSRNPKRWKAEKARGEALLYRALHPHWQRDFSRKQRRAELRSLQLVSDTARQHLTSL